jgi:hypothetical protein
MAGNSLSSGEIVEQVGKPPSEVEGKLNRFAFADGMFKPFNLLTKKWTEEIFEL